MKAQEKFPENTPGFKYLRSYEQTAPKKGGTSAGIFARKTITEKELNKARQKPTKKFEKDHLIKAQSPKSSGIDQEISAIIECWTSELYSLFEETIPKTTLLQGKLDLRTSLVPGNPGPELLVDSTIIPGFRTWFSLLNEHHFHYTPASDKGPASSVPRNQRSRDENLKIIQDPVTQKTTMLGKPVYGVGRLMLISAFLGNIDLNAQNIGFIEDENGSYKTVIIDYGLGLKFSGLESAPIIDIGALFKDKNKLWDFATLYTGAKRENYYSINLISTVEVKDAARAICQVPPYVFKAICDKYEKWLEPYRQLSPENIPPSGFIYAQLIERQKSLRKVYHKSQNAFPSQLLPDKSSIEHSKAYLDSRRFKLKNDPTLWIQYLEKRGKTSQSEDIRCAA